MHSATDNDVVSGQPLTRQYASASTFLASVTPLVLTFNESANIGRTLSRLSWAGDILVVDSFSTDDTLEIVRRYPQARVIQRRFDTFASQCNFGLAHINTEWALSIDADYVLTEALVDELLRMTPGDDVSGYASAFAYCISGRRLRASLYPPRTVLYRRARARYLDDGHGHRVRIDGEVRKLAGLIEHDDRKSLSRWVSDQLRYAEQESEKIRSSPQLQWPDRVRRQIVLAPFVVFFYLLFARGLVLDGWPGWVYVCQRTMAELLLSVRLAEARIGRQTRVEISEE